MLILRKFIKACAEYKLAVIGPAESVCASHVTFTSAVFMAGFARHFQMLFIKLCNTTDPSKCLGIPISGYSGLISNPSL